MLQSIKILTLNYEKIVLKKVNNISVYVLNYKQSSCSDNNVINKLRKFFAHSYIIYFLKIIWRGKAFRIRFFKKSKKFTFNFGHSHWLKLVYNSNQFNFYKIRNQSYLTMFNLREHISFIIEKFNNIKKMNKYTKRGIRIKTTPYIKRFGKISQVNSSLHNFG